MRPYADGIWIFPFKNGRIPLKGERQGPGPRRNGAMGRRKENRMEQDTEALRRELLDEAYAGAFSGLGAMLLDADEIRNADKDELEEIARRTGR